MSLLVSEEPCGCWVEFVPNIPPLSGGHYIHHGCEEFRKLVEQHKAETARLWEAKEA